MWPTRAECRSFKHCHDIYNDGLQKWPACVYKGAVIVMAEDDVNNAVLIWLWNHPVKKERRRVCT